jgi:gliding motility-associated-like protein
LYTTPGVSEFKWVIRRSEDGDTVAVLYDEAPIYTFEDPGLYFADIYVTAEGSNPPWSWTYIRTDTIMVHSKPKADFTVEPKETSVNELIHCYNYSEGAVSYRWNFGMPEANMTSTEENPVISYPKPGRYYITLYVESEYGCSDQKTLDEPVVVLPDGDILFASAFSPNSSSPQDRVFKPIYRGEVVEYQLEIYNRWGQLIYVSKDIEVGWDGTINGALAQQDVYIYKYHVKFRSGKMKDGSGSVTLLR